jgi:hypothetical protein
VQKTIRLRPLLATLVSIGIIASLAACAPTTPMGASGAAGCTAPIKAGAASKLISVKGDMGVAPTVKIPTPLHASTTQSSVVIQGAGKVIEAGQPVVVDVTILNGTTGVVLQQGTYGSGGGSLLTAGQTSLKGVSDALVCSTVGSRIAIIGSPKDTHAGQADEQNGLAKDDALVYVLDVKQAFLARANGADQLPVNNVPSIVLTSSGRPGITIPDLSSPKAFSREVLKQGTGKVVADGKYVVVKYTGVGWDDHKTFDSSWTTGTAALFQVGAANVTAGLSKGIIGERVGSQLVLTVPESLGTGGSEGTGGTPPTGQAAVYVVDILGIAG